MSNHFSADNLKFPGDGGGGQALIAHWNGVSWMT